MTRNPTVISLFSGCGGSSLGYVQAGCKVRLAVEFDNHAVSTYRANFTQTPIYHGDIADLDAAEALELADLEPGALDILDGSPPCQGFSSYGERDLEDERNTLFQEYVRILAATQPKAFVMENVTGLVRIGKMRFIFVEMLQAMKAAGYRVRAQILNAAWYGTPQQRNRIIFIGAREDLEVDPTHPRPTVEREITVREALRDCPGDTPEQIAKYGELKELKGRLKDIAPKLRSGASRGGKHRGKNFLYSEGMDAYVKPEPGFKVGPGHCHQRVNGQRASRTITAAGSDTGWNNDALHPDEDRALSIPEIKRLCGYPDDFFIEGSYKDRRARLGNSVPPPMAKAIAEHVSRTILGVKLCELR